MDYAAEQAMEMEALEAIFMDDMQENDENVPSDWSRHGKTYCIAVTPSDDAESSEAQAEVAMELLFAHTPNYPDEPPSFRLRSVQGLSDADVAAATAILNEQVEANLGMAMIYTLFTAAQEWLTTRATEVPTAPGGSDPDVERRKAEEAAEAARVAARSHGTPVTVEAFMEWKRRFDAEQALQRASLKEKAAAEGPAGVVRLTGKQWFLQHAAVEDGEQVEEGEDEGPSDDGDEDGEQQRGRGDDEDDEDEDSDFDPEDYDDDDDDEELLEQLGKR